MFDEDPFESWSRHDEMRAMLGGTRNLIPRIRERLGELEVELDAALEQDRPPRYDRIAWRMTPVVTMPAGDVPRIESIYRRVVGQGGTSSASVQEMLLDLVGGAASVQSVPFWREMLALTIPRDPFSKKRKRFAVAALAWSVVRRGDEAAFELLLAALRAPDVDARALAAEHLGRAAAAERTKSPRARAIEALARAAEDRAALPRLAARLALKDAGAPVPLDLPGGAYAFKVWRSRDSTVYRVVELRAEQSLDDLGSAIQTAFEWDDDHLYVFWLTGKERDRRYELGHAEMDEVRGYAGAFALGELGLPKGHTFLWLFDFGDKHLFRVKVVGTRTEAGAGPYPRVVESVGVAPPQYPSW